jgi:NAD(P)-dependent dehydrogenase (short-subunit alcohol dehydrogenase family)
MSARRPLSSLDRAVTAGDSYIKAVTCDVTSSAAVDAAVDEVAGDLGGVDTVVNRAGVGAVGDVGANPDQEWHQVLDVNVVGIARVTRAALPHLRRSRQAAIVNACSVVVTVGVPQSAVYAATKGSGRPDACHGGGSRA